MDFIIYQGMRAKSVGNDFASEQGGRKKSTAAAQARGWDLPACEVRGVFRYTRIHGDIYSVYIETIKKFKGLAKYQGGLYADCSLKDLQSALNESKDRRGR